MAINYYSIKQWYVITQEDNYIIDFPFLRRESVVVYLDDVHIPANQLEWTTESQFKILAPVVVNQVVTARRFTKQDVRLVDYHDGSTLVEDDLNIVTKQLLYLIQELSDYRTAGIDPTTIPGQTGDPTDPSGDPDFIQNIIDEILASQVFQNLIALIGLVDINAESIMQNALNNHENWSVQRFLDDVVDSHGITLEDYGIELDTIDAQIIDIGNTIVTNESALAIALAGIAVRFGDAEASILTLSTAFADSETATATLVQQLQAEIDSNAALILDVQTVSATADDAMTLRVNVMESEFISDIATVNARIGLVETTYVSQAGASALIQQEIDVWYEANDWEGLISSSSYINGVEANVAAASADIVGITSYLVGIGDYENPSVGSLGSRFAGLQTIVSGHADEISAEINHTNAMYAFFGGTDGTTMAAAMESRWQVYADEESSIVERTEHLEVNSQPIFFRDVAPDPNTQEFEGTRFETGFPRGSIWHDTAVNTRIISYFWHDTNNVPPGLDVSDTHSFTGITGMWARMIDSELETQGTAIQNLTLLYNDIGGTGGLIETTIQATVGQDITAISETMESWFDTESGHMYSGWQVRINQFNGGTGTPVVAGIGLGMENDPENPEADAKSSLIIMADKFAIIKPPTSVELESELTSENTFIPFIVNTSGIEGEPDVIVNGSMFVKNTFTALDGVAGRFTFTDIDDNTGQPVDDDGARLVLASDTNDYNTAVGQAGSPWVGGSVPQKYWIWAGDGDMNHNNATFYVDTDGNAVFRGEVLADNITGDISNIHNVDVTGGGTTVGGGTGTWVVVATSPTYSPSGIRERTPSVVVNVDMYGTGQTAGRARIEGRSKDSQGAWQAWVTIAEAPIYMPIGTTLTLAGNMAKTSGDVQLRSSIKPEESSPGNWEYPSSSYMKGTLQMLA